MVKIEELKRDIWRPFVGPNVKTKPEGQNVKVIQFANIKILVNQSQCKKSMSKVKGNVKEAKSFKTSVKSQSKSILRS